MSTSIDKLYCAGYGALVFFVMSLPLLYDKTNSFVNEQGTCPTFKSKLLHVLIFFVLILLSMKYFAKSDKPMPILSKYALFGALLFFLFSSREAYRMTNTISPGLMDESNECPTSTGLIVHSLLFGASLYGMTYLPSE